MLIKIKPALALAAGVLIFMIPASLQPPSRLIPSLSPENRAGDGAGKGLWSPREARGMGGLYGYRYRGF